MKNKIKHTGIKASFHHKKKKKDIHSSKILLKFVTFFFEVLVLGMSLIFGGVLWGRFLTSFPNGYQLVPVGLLSPFTSQMGLRKHRYEQRKWRWWNSSWAISNPKRWCCESAALNVPANLENSPVATELEKVTFHSNPKERQRQRMLRLPHYCTHLTC